MHNTYMRHGRPMLAMCVAIAMGGCSTEGATTVPGNGDAAADHADTRSGTMTTPGTGMPRTPETSAGDGGRQDLARDATPDARDQQDMRRDMRQDANQNMRHRPPGVAADVAGTATLQGVGARGVAESVEAVPRSQAAGVGGSVAGAAVGGAVASRSDGTSPGDMVYRIIVRFDDGTTRSMLQDSAADIQSGDRVRVDSRGMLMRE